MNALGYAKTMRALAKVPSQVAKEARDALFARLDAGFNAGTDPYGNAWQALKASTIARKGHSLPGTDTYEMRGTTRVETEGGAGLRIDVGAPHAEHFDKARRLLPDNGLPASWRADIKRIFSERVAKTVGK